MYTSFEERLKAIDDDSYWLYVSSHFFAIPTFLSIYVNRLDITWIYTSVLFTSLLRWGNRDKILYQYIDHNWVKLVFLYIFITFIEVIIENKNDLCLMIYAFGILFSIICLFILEWCIFRFTNYPRVSVTMHLILHFYTVIGGLLCLHIRHNFNQTLWLFPSTVRFLIDILKDTIHSIIPEPIVANLFPVKWGV